MQISLNFKTSCCNLEIRQSVLARLSNHMNVEKRKILLKAFVES